MGDEALEYLKQVSRIKHRILRDYLTPWAKILGSAHPRLGYVDCFAGRGAYHDQQNQVLPGSPLIALRTAKEYVENSPGRCLSLGFSEKNRATAEELRRILASEGGVPGCVDYSVVAEDAQDFVERMLSVVSQPGAGVRIVPTFFFVDPFGHPITIPVMKRLLQIEKTEVLVNLMWFRLNMHLHNPQMRARVDKLFGHPDWRTQSFMSMQGLQKETAFLDYFVSQVGADHHLRCSVPYSPEDRVRGKERRRKFYLVHFSNHPKAALLMKGVMWRAMEDVDDLRFTGAGGEKQLSYLSREPDIEQLSEALLRQFVARRATFDEIQIETLDWPCAEKHYREAIKKLEAANRAAIKRVESKKSGLKGRDIVVFR